MWKDAFYAWLTKDEIDKLAEFKKDVAVLDAYRDVFSLAIEKMVEMNKRLGIVLEGRDASGKGWTYKWAFDYVPSTLHKVVALGIPTPEETEWEKWFERYSVFFPKGREVLTVFDRSWYNRMLVEAVMGFCTKEQYDWFKEHVVWFEIAQQEESDFKLVKVYLSVSREVQKRRLRWRKTKIRKKLKQSPIDKDAIKYRPQYGIAKRRMLEATHRVWSPWHVIDSDGRFEAAIELIKLIINAHREVREEVDIRLKKLKIEIDLEPNPNICRTGKEELEYMNSKWLWRVKKWKRNTFPWKEPSTDHIEGRIPAWTKDTRKRIPWSMTTIRQSEPRKTRVEKDD